MNRNIEVRNQRSNETELLGKIHWDVIFSELTSASLRCQVQRISLLPPSLHHTWMWTFFRYHYTKLDFFCDRML